MDWLRCALPEPNPQHSIALTKPFLQTQIKECLYNAQQRPSHSGHLISTWFRKNKQVGSRDRKIVSHAVYGIIRNEEFLKKAGFQTIAQQVDGWKKLMAGEQFLAVPKTSPAIDFATALSLPVEIAQEWQQKLTVTQCDALAKTINTRAPKYIRVNQQRTDRKALQMELKAMAIESEICPSVPSALKIISPANLVGTKPFQQGKFELQDLSSQRFVSALEITTGMTILDLCAGAGGKSLALADLGAKVYAHDIRSNALYQLQKRAKRGGVSIEIGLPTKVDMVIVDAPCSGTGRLRREPTLRWRYKNTNFIQQCQNVQQELLQKAEQLLPQHGILVYSTCSLLDRENQPVLKGWKTQQTKWIWPQQQQGDGFFWSVMTR